MEFELRPACADDKEAIIKLIPRLAKIEIPDYRKSEHIWEGGRQLYLDWTEGKDLSLWVQVATVEKNVGVMYHHPHKINTVGENKF